MTATCPVCQCEQAEGLLCHDDTTRLERELGDVAAIVAELDVTLSKQARIGNARPSGLARERTPINVGAMTVADDLQNTLTTWARDISGDPLWLTRTVDQRSTARHAAFVLMNYIDSIRRHPAVVELFDEVTDAIGQARRAVDRPADREYLSQCMVETPDDEGRMVTCLAELYARKGASTVTCKVCGITHEVVERRVAMLERARDMLFTVREAAQMLGEVGGIRVTEASIRGYIHRGRIGYHTGTLIRLGDLLAVVVDEGERRTA